MPKRTLSLLTLFSLLATLLAACGGTPAATPTSAPAAPAGATAAPAGDQATAAPAATSAPAASGEPVTLRLIAQSTGEGNAPVDAVIKAFQEAHPNITIQAEYFPIGTGYPEVLRTQLQSGNAPDLFYVSAGQGGLVSVLPFAEAGYTADLSGRPWAATILNENSRHLYWLDNQLTAAPIDLVPIAAVYNDAVFKQLNIQPPTTMPDLLKLCGTVKEQGKSLVALAGANAQNSGLLAATLAANYVLGPDPVWNAKRAKGEVTFANSDGWKKTLQTILDMQQAGCFIPGVEGADIPQAAPMMANGDAAVFVIPTGSLGALRGINKDIQLGAFPLPADTADATRITASPSDAFAASKTSKNLEAALSFLDFFATGQGSEIYAKATGNLSLQQGTTGQGLDPALSGIAPTLQQPDKVLPFINLEWKNPEVYAALGGGVQGLLTGQQTIDDVLKAMDAAWDKQ